MVRKRWFTAIMVIALLLSSSLLTACSSAEESTSMKADVILFDVSSGLKIAQLKSQIVFKVIPTYRLLISMHLN